MMKRFGLCCGLACARCTGFTQASSVASLRSTLRKGSLFMYAVIETGGKQYRVAPGQTIDVDTLAGEVGAAVEFDRVLALSNENGFSVGDALGSARVRATITAHGRGDKVLVF